MTNNPLTPKIGATTTPPRSNALRADRLGDSLLTQLGELLSKALRDASSLEVRTFTSDADAAALARTGDPLTENTRLRAFTRIALDGDTQQCIPLRQGGEPDEALWRLHCEAVDQARKDRAASIDATLATLEKLTGR